MINPYSVLIFVVLLIVAYSQCWRLLRMIVDHISIYRSTNQYRKYTKAFEGHK